ncbi:TIGR02300 family protein [Rhodospirillum rubrum]|uniref:TIGR02300 family protein n=1 Tax=Rhodospirillum rubrum (strain ATCC 11170 / ATH 1.1.1 / DSM 467 / LMG 4362 / NCIMB 8255 / S1) TaxID=269796 RepID=Q2RXP4_RHORT|nr:TIGR02300 family protein [Rhodospirillum rubrum]ABC21101.1 conserved hypothetical protein [Rhodospirillum rubrum ATCC 11170]AEO46769.1 hypothetical protein F11_01495 [Rhodospirillum rubrum F11]MBK5952649.1 TIGR02300 family protein [Rhodospirillum rubrum]QXG80793.1 TIGR02300 family protein [Rhodospirillum rubrum]HAQ00804.1 TIGR02300 family protein [Rhodospirillum rubrum]
MAKPEWGTKRTCTNCGARFYDLQQTPILCPKCETVLELDAPVKPRRTERKKEAVKVAPVAVVEDDEVDADLEVEDEEEDTDLIEDPSDLGEDDDDLEEVKEHLDLDEDE